MRGAQCDGFCNRACSPQIHVRSNGFYALLLLSANNLLMYTQRYGIGPDYPEPGLLPSDPTRCLIRQGIHTRARLGWDDAIVIAARQHLQLKRLPVGKRLLLRSPRVIPVDL